MDIQFFYCQQVIELHREILPASGSIKINLLDGALSRVKNLNYYSGVDDIHVLAAMYLESITKAHAFNDGNKRTAFMVSTIFLESHGYEVSKNTSALMKLTVFAAMGLADTNSIAFALRLLSSYGDEYMDWSGVER
ncbi:TPA: type II toxin-antitoxin system death-on-curing family toxin [Salmonella enterica subsp. salamae serovar 28:r:e,n,z15]|nr:type II toxin-antitoxin system death-on-curing family toxin [Salmonella enterica subsp. salamae serovar 28:r:e,n,z15]